MTRPAFIRSMIGAAAMTLTLTAVPAHAASLLLNGGFEAGFANWTIDNLFPAAGDGRFYLQSGTMSPQSLVTVPPPPEGTFAAMTDQAAPGTHVLYQDFVVPTGTLTGSLSFQYFVNNGGDDFHIPNTLDWSTPALNQRARVDILTSAAPIFSIAPADVLFFSQTEPGDLLVEGYVTFLVDISAVLSANVGNTLRLRFSEVDNVGPFNLGVDAVSIVTNQQTPTPIPEPASLVLVGSGVCAALRRRRA
jgi:hypothetical protein